MYYKVAGDRNHYNIQARTLTVTIAEQPGMKKYFAEPAEEP